jgi:hypothetical protein
LCWFNVGISKCSGQIGQQNSVSTTNSGENIQNKFLQTSDSKIKNKVVMKANEKN